MKKIFLILFSITSLSYSQNKGIIYYGFIDSMMLGDAKGIDYNAYMTFNKEQSYYVTAKDSLEKAESKYNEKNYKSEDGKKNAVNVRMKLTAHGDQVVYNMKNNSLLSSFYYGENYYIKEEATKLNWVITKETKKIGKFDCFKATTSFRGREYAAWFTFEIPIQFGPWKLNGLPGLILEAYDTNKNLYWYFKSVEYPTKNKEKVNNLRKPISKKPILFLNLKEFASKLDAYLENAYQNSVLTAKEYNLRIPKKNEMPSILEIFMEEIK